PTLTARYSHRRLYDLAGAVEKLPNLLPAGSPRAETQTLRATGTDASAPADGPVCTGVARASDTRRDRARLVEAKGDDQREKQASPSPLNSQGVEACWDPVIPGEGRVGDRTRTGDILIHSQPVENATAKPGKDLGSGRSPFALPFAQAGP